MAFCSDDTLAHYGGLPALSRSARPGTSCFCRSLLQQGQTTSDVGHLMSQRLGYVTNFAISLEDDAFVWATAQVEADDEDMASVCAMQFASILFARMQDEAPDWSNCRICVAAPNGDELLVSSAADAALIERDHLRLEPLVRTDH
jgi:hypothetical protein